MDQKDIDSFKEGIFALNTRRFGDVAEIMIKILYHLKESRNLAFDKKTEDNKRVEVKFSRGLKGNKDHIREANVIDQCHKAANYANRVIRSDEIEFYRFDCNIQQIKRKEFDVLYYGIFFLDKIEIFKMESSQILECEGYSDSQHRGNQGEGQFHINNRSIFYHRKNFLIKTLSYKKLYKKLLPFQSN